MSTRSIWMTAPLPGYEAELPEEARPDACVVGAGIAGLTAALALVEAGLDVLVLDQGRVGGGQTARTSAHLASALDDRYCTLERRFGRRGAHLAADSHAAAIDLIEELARLHAPDCDFRRVDGYLFVPPRASRRILRRELAAARRAGLLCDEVERAPLPFDTGPCLRFGNQAELDPIAYVRGLAEAIVACGGRICTGVHVTAIHGGSPAIVELAGGGRVHARCAIDATNTTIASRLALPTREAAYRSYVVALAIAPGYVPHALYWDTDEPYHYLRVAPGDAGREVLLVGGADHRVGQGDPAARWPELERWARERFPFCGEAVARWSGQILEPADGLAYIGALPGEDHVFLATGDSGNGLTHGTIAGMILPALVRGEPHPWAKLYSPSRSRVHALGTLAAEAARGSAPYIDWVRGGDVDSLDDIAPGHGATIRRGVHVLAAYRDPRGQCHLRNARCTHMSGVVRWNDVEESWDCPCHGSRFDPYGHVVGGPAPEDLHDPPADLEQPARMLAPELLGELAPPRLA